MTDKKISELPATTSVASTDIVPVVVDPGTTPVTKKITWANVLASLLGVTGSGASGKIAKWTGTGTIGDATNTDTEVASAVSLKHTQGTDTALGTLGAKDPPIDADKAIYRDSAAADALVTSTWTQIKAFLKTYFDGVYLTTVTPHNILSATHSDTLTDSVVRGDLLIGNVTPKWARLALTVPAAGTLNYLGVNNGELDPSWKSASNNPGAASAILASAPTTGRLTLAALTVDSPTLFVDATNHRVGIGITTPSNTLQVIGGFDLKSTAVGSGLGYGMEFNTNSSTPRIDWVVNGVYTGEFAGSGSDFNITTNSGSINFKLGSDTRLKLIGAGSQTWLNTGTDKNWLFRSFGSSANMTGINNAGTLYVLGTIDALTLALNSASLGNVGIGTASPATLLHTKLTDAGTNAIVNIPTIEHASSGTPAAGFGAGVRFGLASSTTANQDAARLTAEWVVATHASRTARAKLLVSDSAGEREGFRIEASGSAPMMGFLGANAVIRQTGDIIAGLGTFGLFTTPVIPYGAMYANDINVTVTILGADTYAEVGSGMTGGVCSTDFTFQNAKELKCNTAGTYRISYNMTVEPASGTNVHIEGGVMVNTTGYIQFANATHSQNSSDEQPVGGSNTLALAVNDVVKLCVKEETGAINVVVTHANLSLEKVSA